MSSPLGRAAFMWLAGGHLLGACLLDFDEFEGVAATGGGAAPVGCVDGVKSELETDVDCGGPDCPACSNQLACATADDCLSGVCDAETCVPCSSPADCKASQWCDPASVCADLAENGAACDDAAACTSGICVDGVCCDSDCTGLCVSCNLSSAGTCSPVPDGSDPDDECEPPQKDCNGAGMCG